MGRLAVAVIVSSWIIPISILVNRIVPDPYMDEIFHVPQAQQYCKGNFGSWDPMITTPPGLYFLSLAHVACFFPGMFCIQAASSFSDVCSTVALRSTNAILAVICSILVYEIITQLRPALDEMKATLNAIVLALYPLHWFFTFLYYTDVASLTAVLAMYLACLKKNYLFSALLGLLAVFVRQTNIIWVLFVACSGVIECTLTPSQTNVRSDEPGLSVRKDSQLASDKGVTKGSNLRKRRHGNTVETVNYSIQRSAPSTKSSLGLFDEIQRIFYMAWHLKWELLVSLSPFFMVLVAFVAFVSWNGSVVLGAKDAHAVTPHFAQIMYFSLVSALFMAPFHISVHQVAALLQSFWKDRLLSFFQLSAALIAGFLSVHFFSIAHPYLLADNRHYPFYLWRKVINAHWSMKYLLVPLYVYSWFSIFNLLAQAQKKIWVLSYFLASAAVLVPAPLIEFRYYTIPFFFLILHLHINDYRSWLLMGILYIVINIFTIYMFLFRPYSWDHEPGIQRFIW
ncbi:dol-P-Glc:Glc(2)Man(9)GlcNAc(2)-PP-Dol alpha-1,2-glucosyltransferase isoform X1 [Diospyros lotus]|uniref:dol-P-Glc:Glc(2)Man(9)GlcNAc(2)-PP-Dol alpha-1,2-glucosyltransferase isoform X1 n=2 Tax=Diospyros lotus TaxID=55363 RepID=UPI0022534D53|nr:dol-P-Glc:Glc(2)Man(9)GlcNAc(2)-PP-Dol alpha-1,2-glucosyltransferase isoform X1 [Diospyros lotus]